MSTSIVSAQVVDVDSFYNVVNKETGLEVKRKNFQELRNRYLLSQRLSPSDWLIELKRVLAYKGFQTDEYRLIGGSILAGAYEHLDDRKKAYQAHLGMAKLYISSGLGSPGNIMVHYDQAGHNLISAGLLDSAAFYLDKAETLNIEHNLNHWKGYINQADLFKQLGNWDKFDQAWMKGFDIVSKSQRKGQLGYYLYLACTNYFKINNNPERLAFFLNKLDEYQAGKPLDTPKSHYPLLDFLYAPPIDTTIDRLSNALSFNQSLNHFQGTNILSRSLANAYIRNGEYLKAINVVNDQIAIQKDSLKAVDGYLLHGDLHEYYSAVGNKSKAYDALLESVRYKDEYVGQRMKDAAIEAQVKYETERKEKELAQQQALLSKSNQQRNLLVVGGLALLIAAGLLYRLASTRRKNNMVLVEKNGIISAANEEKDNLLKEIHHRVKNNLQIVSSLLSLQSSSTQSEDAKAAIDDGRNRVQSMALIHQNLFIDKERVHVNTKDYIPKLANHIYDSYAPIAKGINLQVNVDSIEMDVDTVVPIGLIINELITNAMKYAFTDRQEGILKVSLLESKGSYEIEVYDNGIGIEKSQKVSNRVGIGSQLIRSFCEKLEAEHTIESDNGTKVNIVIPKSHSS